MGSRSRLVAISSLLFTYLITTYNGSSSISKFIGVFASVALVQGLVLGAWSIILYPYFFSPLRHLPQPKDGNSLFMGQFKMIRELPSGYPHRTW